ncbi:unnamed protein product [Ambrosiozyma monospora]|uniref:Unnamed protein product n=1 Tax=Ambrosiozyma monospora TaxID=43982 RepID=A0ACB5U0X3_AMBMO|nr:unnamed protein product [Ambrosiozyma monospora]
MSLFKSTDEALGLGSGSKFGSSGSNGSGLKMGLGGAGKSAGGEKISIASLVSNPGGSLGGSGESEDDFVMEKIVNKWCPCFDF